jgi:YfiR/HmsC-like
MMLASKTNSSRGASRIPARERTPFLLPWLTALLIGGGLACAASLFAQGSKPSEYEVKAAYLYNFARFVEWPASAALKDNSFAICLLGEDPFGHALDAVLEGESINGKTTAARRIAKPQDATNCRVLFISMSEESRLKGILASLNRASVLTVSDIPEFSRRGGMIQFVSEGSRIRFEVNLASTGNAGLTLSSELLKVAVAVRRNPVPGD